MNVAYNIDCMEYMKALPDKSIDLCLADPPYFSGPERRGHYGSKVSKIGVHRDYPLRRTGKSQEKSYSERSAGWLKDGLCGVAIILNLLSRPEELYGTNAIKVAVFLTAKSRRRIATKVLG